MSVFCRKNFTNSSFSKIPIIFCEKNLSSLKVTKGLPLNFVARVIIEAVLKLLYGSEDICWGKEKIKGGGVDKNGLLLFCPYMKLKILFINTRF